MTKNMTTGSPFKLIMSFALPLLLGNLLQQTYNLIDAAIVGRFLGSDALASVGASSSVQFLVLGFCMGTACGFGVPIARHFGAGDIKNLKQYFYNSIVITAVTAFVLTTVCAVLCSEILKLLSTPSNIFDDAYKYLLVIFLGIPFTLLYNLLSSVLRSVGDSKTPFVFLAISTVLNIALDLVCVIVFRWGCMGAAIATVVAQAISGILCAVFIMKKVSVLKLAKEDRVMSKPAVLNLIIMGFPMGLQYSITAIGSMVMQSANNKLGSIYVSGFTAGARIKQFTMCPYDAFATGASVFASQNLGAGNLKRIKNGIRIGVGVGMTYGVIAGIVLIFFGRELSLIFVNKSDAAVLTASAKYLFYAGFFYWTLGILNTCRMCTQGLGYSGLAIFSGVTEMIARISVSMIFVPKFGYLAICFTDQAAWIAACLYIVPVCIYCVNRAGRHIAGDHGLPVENK